MATDNFGSLAFSYFFKYKIYKKGKAIPVTDHGGP
jgi:hypothetical protein